MYFHSTWFKIINRTKTHKNSEKKGIKYSVNSKKKLIGNLQYIIITRETTNNFSSRLLFVANLFPHYMG